MATQRSIDMELPYDSDGSVDWNTLGNILVGKILGEVLNAGYIDPKHQESHPDNTSITAVDTDWRFEYEKDNIVVLKKQSVVTRFMGRGLIDAPWRDVANFINDIQSTYTWDRFLSEIRRMKVLSESDSHIDYIGYQRFETTQCFVKFKRDMLYFIRCAYIDGKYVYSTVSIEDPDYPPFSDVPRITVYMGSGFVVEPFQGDETKALVSYTGNFDIKGIPPFIMTQVMRRHPLVIRYIRRQFTPAAASREPARCRPHSGQREARQLRRGVEMSAEFSLLSSGHRFEDAVSMRHFLTGLRPSNSLQTHPKRSFSASILSDWEKSLEPSSLHSSAAAVCPNLQLTRTRTRSL